MSYKIPDRLKGFIFINYGEKPIPGSPFAIEPWLHFLFLNLPSRVQNSYLQVKSAINQIYHQILLFYVCAVFFFPFSTPFLLQLYYFLWVFPLFIFSQCLIFHPFLEFYSSPHFHQMLYSFTYWVFRLSVTLFYFFFIRFHNLTFSFLITLSVSCYLTFFYTK